MKKRFTIAIIQIFLLAPITWGQQENFIFNGSLEEFINCPFNNGILNVKGWSAGVPGGNSSTDYYHECAGTVPQAGSNWHQYPFHGKAFFGAGNSLGNLDSTVPTVREFASGKLVRCLEANKRYRLVFWVSPPDNLLQKWLGYDCFEVLFHSNEFALDGQNLGVSRRFNEVAQQALRMPVSEPIIESGIWHKLELEFFARGDECFFTVGCFKWLRTENIDTLIGTGPSSPFSNGIYYLYDDFVLTEIPDDTTPPPAPEPVVPNVFTPNADGQNDYWVIKHLPPATSVAIYNRWGQRVYFSENYTNDWGGEGLPSGTYIAELVFSDLPPKRQAVYLKRE